MTHHECGHDPVIVDGMVQNVCSCWARTPDDIVNAAVHALTVQGCTCDPRVEFAEFEPGKYRVTALHDRWCPRLRAVRAVNN